MRDLDREVPNGNDVDMRRQSITATSLDEAEDIVRQLYVPHSLNGVGHSSVSFRLDCVESPRITVGRLRYGAEVELIAPPMGSAYHLNLPVRGRVRAKQAKQVGDSAPRRTATVFDPKKPHVARWSSDAVVYAVKLRAAAVEDHLHGLLGHHSVRRLEFPLSFDLRSGATNSMFAAVRFLWRELRRPSGIAASPSLSAQLEDFVLTQVLTAIPHSLRDALSSPIKRVSRRHVVDVLNYMHAHPQHPLSVAEMARIGGVGVRALQEGFRVEVGVPPTVYLRGLRLDCAHADLKAAEPGESVTSTAMRWGFVHLSRFSELYKRRFGVSPSVTLNAAVSDRR